MENKSASEDDKSMADILQSIRDIIADEGDGKSAADNNSDDAEGADSAVPTGSDVLELTDLVSENSAPEIKAEIKTETKPENKNNSNDILSTIDQVVMPETNSNSLAHSLANSLASAAPASAVATASAMLNPNGQAYIDSLLSNEAAIAAANAFRRAMPADEPIRTTQSPHFRSGNSVEDLVMEALRPMLKSWLDENLPTIVEKLVEREVRKLAH